MKYVHCAFEKRRRWVGRVSASENRYSYDCKSNQPLLGRGRALGAQKSILALYNFQFLRRATLYTLFLRDATLRYFKRLVPS
jgi:hypothetical protein